MKTLSNKNPWVQRIARTGLTAKGIVYLILGILAFMTAFEMGKQSDDKANQGGVFEFIQELPAGSWLLGFIAAGLLCYSIWRGVQTFANTKESAKKQWLKRLRYLFSGLTYLSLAFTATQILTHSKKENGDQNQHWAKELLNQPFGQWLVGIAALAISAVGIYQVWYGLSEKYKKHVEGLNLHSAKANLLMASGKIGYVARGVAWLIIAYLFLRAAIEANAQEAGDTAKAFQFIENSSFGSVLLGALGIGFIAYGIFNFIRARFETFE